jgi:hypothetical protein
VQRQDEAPGVGQPVDPGHPDLAAALDVAERELLGRVPLGRQPLGVLGPPRHVAPGGEPLVGAGEAHGVELGLGVGPDRGPLEGAVHVLGEGVATLGAIDAQVQHTTPDLGHDVTGPEVGRLDRCGGCVGHARP